MLFVFIAHRATEARRASRFKFALEAKLVAGRVIVTLAGGFTLGPTHYFVIFSLLT